MPSKNTCLQGYFCDGIHEQAHFEKCKCDSILSQTSGLRVSSHLSPKNLIFYTEAYRSGHNEAVLKTVCLRGHGGSNPSASAKKHHTHQGVVFF